MTERQPHCSNKRNDWSCLRLVGSFWDHRLDAGWVPVRARVQPLLIQHSAFSRRLACLTLSRCECCVPCIVLGMRLCMYLASAFSLACSAPRPPIPQAIIPRLPTAQAIPQAISCSVVGVAASTSDVPYFCTQASGSYSVLLLGSFTNRYETHYTLHARARQVWHPRWSLCTLSYPQAGVPHKEHWG